MSGRLDGKVVVITGGVSGIGLASVELAVEEGARVVVGDIQDELGAAVENRFKGAVAYRHTNIMDDAAIGALVQAAVDRFGRLDVMYNNAGAAGDPASMLELTAEGLARTDALLTGSVVAGHKYAARQFIKQGSGGAIVSTASAAGLEGGWSTAAYTVAKHAVIGIVRQAVAELGRHNIRSNAICPGLIMTPIMAAAFGVSAERSDDFIAFLHARLDARQPSGRLGRPRDIAEVFAFLASDAAEHVNGAIIPVDGGSTAITLGGAGASLVEAAQAFNAGER